MATQYNQENLTHRPIHGTHPGILSDPAVWTIAIYVNQYAFLNMQKDITYK